MTLASHDERPDRDHRPSPEALLRQMGREARGRLKVFLGAAPGVGKTYAMLQTAQARRREGADVVVAIPHARIEGIQHIFGLFVRLERPIDFAAVDAQPADLVVLLLIPANAGSEHLAALSSVSRRLRDREVAQALRRIKGSGELYQQLVGRHASSETHSFDQQMKRS